ncbi:MAG: hypothetical protein ACLPXM_09160 [Terriglobales bacterium]
MNRKQLPKLKNKHVRIRPIHRRFDGPSGLELPPIDNIWIVRDADGHGVVIENSGFGHTLKLAADQLHDFRSDPSGKSFGFLILHGQIWVRGREGGIEPSVFGRRPRPRI